VNPRLVEASRKAKIIKGMFEMLHSFNYIFHPLHFFIPCLDLKRSVLTLAASKNINVSAKSTARL